MPAPTKAELLALVAAYRAAVAAFLTNYHDWQVTIAHLKRGGKFDAAAHNEWNGQTLRMEKFCKHFVTVEPQHYGAIKTRLDAELVRWEAEAEATAAASPPTPPPRSSGRKRRKTRAGAALRP